MGKTEILAPAGGMEQLTAAVRSGADAVYFGATAFNARRNAENFTDEDFIGAVRYCRERGVRAYITLNTIFKDSEAEEFIKTLSLIAKSGADAVIVQDMGAAALVKKCCPDIPLHASTQMACHNVAGARLLEEAGFSRIVLARELSLEEIKEITDSVSTEIEVFVHGAHCMSVSGMCYMSSLFGCRSGNRGLCAQPCRLNFRTDSREYALSLKDMCLAEKTDRLIGAGVTSLKIEGRMKRPEYVSAAVIAYKNAVNGKEADVGLLRDIFSRSGFTDGYFEGKRELSMFGYRTKDDVLAAADKLSSVAEGYRNENPLIEITMDFSVKKDTASCLEISDGKNTVTVTGPVPEAAIKAPLSRESAVKSLSKLGSTFYYCNKINTELDDGLMLRASDINAMRREATEKLTEIRGFREPYAFYPWNKPLISRCSCDTPEIRAMFRSVKNIPEGIEADKIILPVGELLRNPDIVEKYRGRLYALLPSLIYPSREERLSEALMKLREAGIRNAWCENLGAVRLAKNAGMNVTLGTLNNVINSVSCEAWHDMGVSEITLSPETSFKEMKGIATHCRIGMTAYGYIPLMHFRCCPLQKKDGCKDCKGHGSVTDRMGEKFNIVCENRNYSVLYNTVPLYVGDRNIPPVSYVLLRFINEAPVNVSRIIDAVKNKKALPGKKTAGLYERELL